MEESHELMPALLFGADRLLAYHVCDWLTPTRDLLNDRGMMGDGVIELRKLRALVEAAGYRGAIEVEIFSNAWWSEPMARVLDGIDAGRVHGLGGAEVLFERDVIARRLRRSRCRRRVDRDRIAASPGQT